MKLISASEYRLLFQQARMNPSIGNALDLFGQPPFTAKYAQVPGYAFWYSPRTCGTVELGGVFRTHGKLSGIRLSAVISGLRAQGFKHVEITAYRTVAEKVWAELGFKEWSRIPFNWEYAPLHMHPKLHKPEPVLYMSKVL